MNRSERRAKARRQAVAHTCDFTGGVTCNICGRRMTREEAGPIIAARIAKACEFFPGFGGGHSPDPPRTTQQEQIAEIAKTVEQRKQPDPNRVEGHAVIRKSVYEYDIWD